MLQYPGRAPGMANRYIEPAQFGVSNAVLSCTWTLDQGSVVGLRIENRGAGQNLIVAAGSMPRIILGDDRMIDLSELQPLIAPYSDGDAITIRFGDDESGLECDWSVSLQDYSNAVIQSVAIKASTDTEIREVVFIDAEVPGAHQVGEVDGSVVVCGDIFMGVEHPLAKNLVVTPAHVRCALALGSKLAAGQTRCYSSVLGVAPTGQLRRGFLYYLEGRRIHPYRQFLHYNNWYDVWLGRAPYRVTEAECLEAIEYFGRELVTKRGVKLDALVWDDGWDDFNTLWGFHKGFPDGFRNLVTAARKYGADQGVWLSPNGGYATAKASRIAYGRPLGYETNNKGYAMGGPNYRKAFRDVCLHMIRDNGVAFFKFDGMGEGGTGKHELNGASGALSEDIASILELSRELHAEKTDLYVSATVGTWASPYWLLYADNIWRQGGDTGFYGEGNSRQQWITYRDMFTYNRVVKAGPLYPLNALMLCGVVIGNRPGRQPSKLVVDEKSIADEIWSFFGSGTCLQELYVSPGVPSEAILDEIARAAKWARENENILIDTHWVGGSPEAGNVYGWASWQHGKGILTLRNPSAATQRFIAKIRDVLELPEGESSPTVMQVVYGGRADTVNVPAFAEGLLDVALHPFQTLVLQFVPATVEPARDDVE